ncbi:MAG: restriction endonuclease subunit S [Burkholderiaceae bacterium]|nr:restriction endonuclease subunit S [Burkholderiaceae bacterium]
MGVFGGWGMKAGWSIKRFADVLEIRNGKNQREVESKDGVYPIFGSAGNVMGYATSFICEAGTTIIGRKGNINTPIYSETNFWNVDTAFGLAVKLGLDSKFLFYYCLSFDFSALNRGTTIPSLVKSELLGISIPVPPLPEQQRIVALLDETFDGIATARAHAEKNLQNARAIFESHLQSVFSQRGDGWTEKRLTDVCAITSTLVDPRKPEFLDLTHVGAGNIESKTGAFIELKTAREEGLISGKFLFDESMVLYSKIRPYLMKVARPDFSGLCSADMYPLAPTPNEADKDYLFHLLLSKQFTDYAIQGSARAGMPKVNREHLFAFRVFMPSVGKQREIAEKLNELHEETQRLESIYQQKLTALDALKKSLLHLAFSGQL